MPLEIEMRARFDQATHERLIARLEKDGESLGQDDKRIFFYTLPGKLLKVTDNVTAGSAKISLKAAKIGQGAAFPETEISISREDVPAAVSIFNALGFGPDMHEAFNERRNYRFRGVEIALKWSQAWGCHAEFEVLLGDEPGAAAQEEASRRIRAAADELGVRLMSEPELAAFTAAFEEAERKRKAAEARSVSAAE